MSSWERARYIPWDRIPTSSGGSSNLDEQKERIFRELQRETIQDELRQQQEQRISNPALVGSSLNNGDADLVEFGSNANDNRVTAKPRIPYSHMELLRQAAFGGCIGTITGAVFGFMDSMRTAGESTVLQKASNMAKGRYLFQGTTRSATLFGVFFGGFHMIKYGIRVVADPGDVTELGLAGTICMGALATRPGGRASLPYAGMLILIDGAHIFMRKTS